MNLGDLVEYNETYMIGANSKIGIVVGFREFEGTRGKIFRQLLVYWSPAEAVHTCDFHAVKKIPMMSSKTIH